MRAILNFYERGMVKNRIIYKLEVYLFFNLLTVPSQNGCQLEIQGRNLHCRYTFPCYFATAANNLTNFKSGVNFMVWNQIIFLFLLLQLFQKRNVEL